MIMNRQEAGSPRPGTNGGARLLFFGGIVVAAAFLFAFTKTFDPDVPWHVKTGLVMLERGSLLSTNTFSSTFPDYPWHNPEALFQVALGALHRAGGFRAVGALKVLLAVAIALTLYALMAGTSGHPGTAAALAIVAICAMQFRLTERPHLVSYFFFVLTLAIAVRSRRHPRAAWWLPPLHALWSNIHPELVFGLLALGALLAGDAAERIGAAGPAPRRARLLLPALLCVPAACLNPEGWNVLLYPFLHTSLGSVVPVLEYEATGLSTFPLFWAAVATTVAVAVWRRRDMAMRDVLLAAGMGMLGALYLRATPYFFLAAVPLAHRLAAVAAETQGRGAARRLGALALIAAAASVTWASRGDLRWGLGLDDSYYPVAAATAIERNALPGRLFNLFGDGGYLIYRLYPQVGVFQDGRIPAYPREFLARVNAGLGVRDWPRIVAEFGVNTLVLPREAVAPLAPAAQWGIVFWDDRWCVLVRRSAANDQILSRLEYRLFLPGLRPPQSLQATELAALAREMERNQGERQEPSPALARALEQVRARLGTASPG